MKLIVLIIGIIISQPSEGSDTAWLAAAYIDTLNSINVKGGVALKEPYEYDENRPHYYGSFKYIDAEVGLKGYKLGLGVGSEIGHGIDRAGLSYAKIDTQELAGVEAVMSQMLMSVKFGYYFGLENTKNRWLLGLGFGF